MNPAPTRIIATPYDKKVESSYLTPDSMRDKPLLARITHIGANVAQYCIGDIILYSTKYDSTKETITLDQEYLFLTEADILATIEEAK